MTRESLIWPFGRYFSVLQLLEIFLKYLLVRYYRFFERIAKTYRRERWHALLRPLLSTWYACAKQLGDVELSIKLLVEMIGHGK